MRLLDAAGGRGRLAGGFAGELLSRDFSASGFERLCFGACHECEADGKERRIVFT
jgi:hypothetical protein